MNAVAIDLHQFQQAFSHFKDLIQAHSGHEFTGFHEGVAARWESYKLRLHAHARTLLRAEEWLESDIGGGAILKCTIGAIEIQATTGDITNNLVFWQNRFGHANRDHRVLLEASTQPKLRREIEQLLFRLFHAKDNDGSIFDRLSALSNGKYPLLAYLFFLKNMDRFMPIQPTGFDRAFRALGIKFSTLRQCNWENYTSYNQTLVALRPHIEAAATLNNLRLLDVHSFCWIFSSLLKLETEGLITKKTGKSSDGRIVGGWERSIIEMRTSVLNTVRNSNGQVVNQVVKDKQSTLDSVALDSLLKSRLEMQQWKCNLTGLVLSKHGPDADPDMLPSVDRINSDGHYEIENIQIVCRFINFWKGASDNEKFKRLLLLVQGVEQ